MMKKIVSLLLILTFALSMASMVYADQEQWVDPVEFFHMNEYKNKGFDINVINGKPMRYRFDTNIREDFGGKNEWKVTGIKLKPAYLQYSGLDDYTSGEDPRVEFNGSSCWVNISNEAPLTLLLDEEVSWSMNYSASGTHFGKAGNTSAAVAFNKITYFLEDETPYIRFQPDCSIYAASEDHPYVIDEHLTVMSELNSAVPAEQIVAHLDSEAQKVRVLFRCSEADRPDFIALDAFFYVDSVRVEKAKGLGLKNPFAGIFMFFADKDGKEAAGVIIGIEDGEHASPLETLGIDLAALLAALLLSNLGGTAGAEGAAAVTGAGSTPEAPASEPPKPSERPEKEDLGPYIRKDEDGDLHVKDPATGEERLYVDQGDGTFRNPLTGAEYTKEELKSSLESRSEHADQIAEDEAKKNAAINAHREQNKELSEGARIYAEEKARLDDELKRDLYKDHLHDKYGTQDDGEMYSRMMDRKDRAEAESQRQLEKAATMDKAVMAAEIVQAAADTGVDILAEATGGVGKGIKYGYIGIRNTTSRLSDAVVNNKAKDGAFAMAAFDTLADLTQSELGGKGFHFTSNIGSEVFKNGMQNLYEGKDFDEGITKAVLKGGVKGGIDKFGAVFSGNMNSAVSETLKNDMKIIQNTSSAAGKTALYEMRTMCYINNRHAEMVTNMIVAGSGDAAKIGSDAAIDTADAVLTKLLEK